MTMPPLTRPDLPRLALRPLFDLQLSVPPLLTAGGPTGMEIRSATIAGGSFAGARLAGSVEPGGLDWQTLRGDGAIEIDARILLRTDEDDLIAMEYRGFRHANEDVMARIAAGEEVPPASYFLRTTCTFSTSATRFEWLNRTMAIAIGARLPSGPFYEVHELL